MGLRYQLRRKDKRHHLVVSEGVYNIVRIYAREKDTTITDAIYQMTKIAIQHEFPKFRDAKYYKQVKKGR